MQHKIIFYIYDFYYENTKNRILEQAKNKPNNICFILVPVNQPINWYQAILPR